MCLVLGNNAAHQPLGVTTMTKTTKTTKSTKSTVAVPATPSVAAQLAAAAPQIAAQAAEKPAKRTAPDLKLVLTAKGAKFSPRGKSEVSKTKDQITWPKIQALFADNGIHTMAEVLALIPDHRDYAMYAVRSGWLATAAA